MGKTRASAVRSGARVRHNLFIDKIDEHEREVKEDIAINKDLAGARAKGLFGGGLLGVAALTAVSGGLSLIPLMAAAAAGGGLGSFGAQKSLKRKKGGTGLRRSTGKFFVERDKQANRDREGSILSSSIRDATTAAKTAHALFNLQSSFQNISKLQGVGRGSQAFVQQGTDDFFPGDDSLFDSFNPATQLQNAARR